MGIVIGDSEATATTRGGEWDLNKSGTLRSELRGS